MKTVKKMTARQKDFAQARFSDSRTVIAKICASARFWELSHDPTKSDVPACEPDIVGVKSERFDRLSDISPRSEAGLPKSASASLCSLPKIRRYNMNIRNEIKAQIVRAGFTMQELVDRLADEYDWSDSVSNFSAKLQRESIRYKEVVELADVLGYDLVWQKRRENR